MFCLLGCTQLGVGTCVLASTGSPPPLVQKSASLQVVHACLRIFIFFAKEDETEPGIVEKMVATHDEWLMKLERQETQILSPGCRELRMSLTQW